MSDQFGASVPDVDDGQRQQQDQGENIAQLREAAKQGARLQKENLFLRAGIDTAKPLAQLLFKSYDGEMTVEAVTAMATEIGLLGAPVVPANVPSAADLEQQAMRDAAMGGAPAGADTELPAMQRAQVLRDFHADMQAGADMESAQLVAIDKFISQAAEGNKQFLFDDDEWIRERSMAGHDFRPKR